MKLIEKAAESLIRWQYAKIAKHLSSVSAQRVEKVSEFRALTAFKRAAYSCPGYKRILEERGVSPSTINTIEQFKDRVPILDKTTVFSDIPLKDLCPGGSLRQADYFWSSSGQSGEFSFAADSRSNFAKAAYGVEFLLHNLFDVLSRRTLLINCTPMGVHIPTRTIAVADTSVRSDVALALVKKLAGEFDQIILVGESLFIKKLLEEGLDDGVRWNQFVVHVITGGEFIPESFRTYAMHILGIQSQSVDDGIIAINMGVSELSTVIFSDNLETIQLRRHLQDNFPLRKALAGENRAFSPELLQFFPMNTFVESIKNNSGDGELVVTMLNPSATIPLIRYNTKDIGDLISYEKLTSILKEADLENLQPKFRLPLSLIWGRNPAKQPGSKNTIHPNRVKELLYEDATICSALTGNFRIENSLSSPCLLFQLRPQFTPRESLTKKFGKKFEEAFDKNVRFELVPYKEFPYGIELNYEKKMQYC